MEENGDDREAVKSAIAGHQMRLKKMAVNV